MNILLAVTAATLSAFIASGQEAPGKLLDDAEAIMFSSCLQNKARSISECGCYGKGLRAKMPMLDYHFFMETLYFSNNRDKDGFDKVMKKYGKKLEDLEVLGNQVAKIGAKIEVECNSEKSELPKPTAK